MMMNCNVSVLISQWHISTHQYVCIYTHFQYYKYHAGFVKSALWFCGVWIRS